ncbi:hypothetical protein [Arthrobacter alkaliphilus]|nr:hypothetical protein [Arthrobacter alkaliphilus]
MLGIIRYQSSELTMSSMSPKPEQESRSSQQVHEQASPLLRGS